ncbi:uncharacterized protein LY89DRAFT_790704 [Mollisia scopiformis]|uniref:Uncharacterized protein n=1 Tax=Mollisia scopiformis TaxID=149040 RepID=A0A132B1T1_MOLSC|nr:uncharacterized protein LY89DRAFT_790704 [Mollisia scopiformis]KUJ06193.1 hypothetical protein LY89DRAFT_790704 [Mollisia scopiformis]
MMSSQEKQTKSPRARAEARAEAKADNDLSFGSEPEFLKNNNEFEHHAACLLNNPLTDPAFDDNTENEDEMNAKQVMDAFMEAQKRWFFFIVALVFGLLFLLAALVLGWGHARYRY